MQCLACCGSLMDASRTAWSPAGPLESPGFQRTRGCELSEWQDCRTQDVSFEGVGWDLSLREVRK